MTMRKRIARAGKAIREIVWPDAPPGSSIANTDNGGAAMNRLLMDWVTSCMSPDQEVKGTLRRLRSRARELERNNSWAASYLNLATANVIGPHGFRHLPRVTNNNGDPAKAINDKLRDGFEEWSYAVTMDGKFSFTEFQHQLLRTERRDGEVFVRMHVDPSLPYGLGLEAIDADLIDDTVNRAAGNGQNEIRMGVEVNAFGRPIAYYYVQRSYSEGGPSLRQRIPAEEMIHLYRPRRVNQTRGITSMLSVMVSLRMLDGYEEAELVAARIAAAKMGFFVNKGEVEGEAKPDTEGPQFMDANPGSFEKLPLGWGMETFDPTHPTSAFPTFQKSMLRKLASGLGVSYNALCSDLEGVNYSSMRSGLLIERDTWRTLQEWWACAFLKPVYLKWLNAGLLTGDLVLDSRDFRKFKAVRWAPRGWTWVDPLKDTQAGVTGIQNGLASRTQLLAEQGVSYEDVLRDLADEEELAEEYGVDISEPLPGGMQETNDEGDPVKPGAPPANDTPAPKKKKSTLPGAIAERIALLGNGNGHVEDE